jgi:hypothetical protein
MELAELSKLVAEYDVKRIARLAADKYAAALKKNETALAERLITEMRSQGVNFCASGTRRVKMTTKQKPKAEDWPKIWEYMAKFDAMDLVQKRLGEAAVQERLDDGIEIPGIVWVEVDTLSIGNI